MEPHVACTFCSKWNHANGRTLFLVVMNLSVNTICASYCLKFLLSFTCYTSFRTRQYNKTDFTVVVNASVNTQIRTRNDRQQTGLDCLFKVLKKKAKKQKKSVCMEPPPFTCAWTLPPSSVPVCVPVCGPLPHVCQCVHAHVCQCVGQCLDPFRVCQKKK
jgi:hypothetical protein